MIPKEIIIEGVVCHLLDKKMEFPSFFYGGDITPDGDPFTNDLTCDLDL